MSVNCVIKKIYVSGFQPRLESPTMNVFINYIITNEFLPFSLQNLILKKKKNNDDLKLIMTLTYKKLSSLEFDCYKKKTNKMASCRLFCTV